jgi:DNA-binding transcriptional regulator YiaG
VENQSVVNGQAVDNFSSKQSLATVALVSHHEQHRILGSLLCCKAGEVSMHCIQCTEGDLVDSFLQHTHVVAGRVFKMVLKARRCNSCQECHIDGTELQRADLAIARELALSADTSAEGFRFMREAIGLACQDIIRALGVTPGTLARWESGFFPVPELAARALGQLVLARTGTPGGGADPLPSLECHPLARTQSKPRHSEVA